MGISSDYNTLLNKYNRLAASHKDLQQQLKEKTGELRNLERLADITKEQIRKFCEEILAKDRREMVLGKSYTWKSLSPDELMSKATESYRAYNAARADLMTRIMDELEQERINKESLQSQLESLMIHNRSNASFESTDSDDEANGFDGGTGNIGGDDLSIKEDTQESNIPQPQIKHLLQPSATKTVSNKSIENAPYKIQQAAKAGAIELIVEEDSDVNDADLTDIAEVASLADALVSQMKDIPVTQAEKKIKQREVRDKQKSEAFLVDLAKYRDKMTDVAWIILDAVGTYGLSRYAEIDAKTLELFEGSGLREQYKEQGKITSITSARIRTTIQNMENLGVLQRERIHTPLVSVLVVYSLAPMGTSLYRDKFSKDPMLSERDKIVAEHDNLEHGFGVVSISEMFIESGFFKDVCCSPSKNSIKLEGNTRYVADIITQGKHKGYYEYERGSHHQKDFEIKLNKMGKVTNFLNIITNNKENMEVLNKQVERWIQSRGGFKVLSGKRVRIATATSLKGKNPENNESWDIIYDMKSDKPILNAANLQL